MIVGKLESPAIRAVPDRMSPFATTATAAIQIRLVSITRMSHSRHVEPKERAFPSLRHCKHLRTAFKSISSTPLEESAVSMQSTLLA